MKNITVIIFLLLVSTGLFAQGYDEDFESALFPTKDGAEVVYSSPGHSLTLHLISKDVKPQQHPGMVLIDNKILQFVNIANPALKKDKGTEDEMKAQLLGYMNYELDYVKNEAKVNYSNLSHEFIYVNGKLFLFWHYDMPPENQSVLKQVNLCTLCFEHAFNLNTPFEKGNDLEVDKAFLLQVAKTLKLNDFKINFDEEYKRLNGG